MNRQEIVDQLEALSPKYDALRRAAQAGLDAEKASLQSACGEIGHVYRTNLFSLSFQRRSCAICDQLEPMATVSMAPFVAQ
jgi:hypothetical protein